MFTLSTHYIFKVTICCLKTLQILKQVVNLITDLKPREMSDIFISYAHQDRGKAREISSRLTREGWSVFWDRVTPVGKTWDEILEKELKETKAIIVLWSAHSVASEWVRAEAAEAASRNILVPVTLELVTIPIRFRFLQTADLSDWNSGEPDTEGMRLLIEAVKNIGNLESRKIETKEKIHRQHKRVLKSGPDHPEQTPQKPKQEEEIAKLNSTENEIIEEPSDLITDDIAAHKDGLKTLTPETGIGDALDKPGKTNPKNPRKEKFNNLRYILFALAAVILIIIVIKVVKKSDNDRNITRISQENQTVDNIGDQKDTWEKTPDELSKAANDKTTSDPAVPKNINRTDSERKIDKTSAKVTPKVEYGQINLDTEIGGELFLDDKRLGNVLANTQNNGFYNIPAGIHLLKIIGTENWQQSITVNPNQTTKIEAQKAVEYELVMNITPQTFEIDKEATARMLKNLATPENLSHTLYSLPGDAILGFRAVAVNRLALTIEVDYRYNEQHGQQVYVGASLKGVPSDYIPTLVPSFREGTAKLQINARQPGISTDIEIFLWEPGKVEIFAIRVFTFQERFE